MEEITLKARAALVSQDLGLPEIDPNWLGCDPVWNIFEAMSAEGAIVLIKIDGLRTGPEDNGRYTVLVSGGPLGEDFFRTDTNELEEGLAKAILHYSQRCWKKA